MTFNECKITTYICWNEKYQLLTIDMRKDKYTGRLRSGVNSIFVSDNFHF